MPISALPTPPSRSDSPQDFSDRADALLGALPGFVTEANALQSDVNAKEASASSYATIATNKAAEAQAYATTASTKASEAAASAVAAAAAASNAESAFDSFDDKYLGSKASDPTVDNDGNALLTGALYWNTTANQMRVWNGSSWKAVVEVATATKLQTARTLTIGNTGKSFDGSSNVSWSLAEIGATNAGGNYIVHDTRDVGTPTDLGERGVKYEFKTNGTDGLHDGGAHHAVMTFQQWGDSSGGNTHQLGFTNNGNLWLRTAPIGGTWGPWRRFFHSGNIGAATESSAGIVQMATAAEAQGGTDGTKALSPLRLRNALNAPGSAPIYACRAWVNFNGTGTVAIRASGNVSSITDNGVGDYTVNFTTAMPDANYAVVGICGGGPVGAIVMSGSNIIAAQDLVYAAGSLSILALDASGNTPQDPAFVNVAIFR